MTCRHRLDSIEIDVDRILSDKYTRSKWWPTIVFNSLKPEQPRCFTKGFTLLQVTRSTILKMVDWTSRVHTISLLSFLYIDCSIYSILHQDPPDGVSKNSPTKRLRKVSGMSTTYMFLLCAQHTDTCNYMTCCSNIFVCGLHLFIHVYPVKMVTTIVCPCLSSTVYFKTHIDTQRSYVYRWRPSLSGWRPSLLVANIALRIVASIVTPRS